MSDAKSKALEKKKNYSFLTRNSFRIDASGKSPRDAYVVARAKAKHYNKYHKESKSHGDSHLSGTYFKYNKEGLHANDGRYSQYRPSRFRKHDKHE